MENTGGKRLGGGIRTSFPRPACPGPAALPRHRHPETVLRRARLPAWPPRPGRPPGRARGGAMANTSARRMTLRQLLTASEKCSRDLANELRSTLLVRVSDARELSRPVRGRSHYPTVLAVANALNKLGEAHEEIQALTAFLT